MPRSFKEMLDSKSDAELGAMCRDRFERLMDAHARGISDEHPAEAWNDDNRILRDHYRATRDARDTGQDPGDIPSTGNVGEAKEIERADQSRPQASDDPPNTPGAARLPERPGAALAANDAALRAAIPGLDRLGVPSYRGPKVDDDGVVQSPMRGW